MTRTLIENIWIGKLNSKAPVRFVVAAVNRLCVRVICWCIPLSFQIHGLQCDLAGNLVHLAHKTSWLVRSFDSEPPVAIRRIEEARRLKGSRLERLLCSLSFSHRGEAASFNWKRSSHRPINLFIENHWNAFAAQCSLVRPAWMAFPAFKSTLKFDKKSRKRRCLKPWVALEVPN